MLHDHKGALVTQILTDIFHYGDVSLNIFVLDVVPKHLKADSEAGSTSSFCNVTTFPFCEVIWGNYKIISRQLQNTKESFLFMGSMVPKVGQQPRTLTIDSI